MCIKVKPNVGHAEGASGITSLIKAVLALENKTIPPNIKFSKPNPKSELGIALFAHPFADRVVAVPFKEANLQVPLEPIAWPKDRAERVSVNSFGIGGANAHVTQSIHGDNSQCRLTRILGYH